ncbi:DEAD/DEAH box helicase [Microbacterium halophytorum]|uniref:DEAD/DEAH box helicase n=1 Tax=Microbacterium halophytorum TaxID=2067568 RepID=UPI000CFB6299|nr:DEAD/DEAH box helicase [Microbacterium halophytorum]
MPKNKKPAGGRPAKNFDPRYAKKKPHRGQGGVAGKNRWSDEDRAKRDDARAFSRDNGGAKGSDRGYGGRVRDDRDSQARGARGGRGYDADARRRAADRADRGHADGFRDDRRSAGSRGGGSQHGDRRFDRGASDARDDRRSSGSRDAGHERNDRRASGSYEPRGERGTRHGAGGRETYAGQRARDERRAAGSREGSRGRDDQRGSGSYEPREERGSRYSSGGRNDRGGHRGRGRDDQRHDRDDRRSAGSRDGGHARDGRRTSGSYDFRGESGSRHASGERSDRGSSDGRGHGDRRGAGSRGEGFERGDRRASGSHDGGAGRSTGFGGRRESAGERAWRENRDARQKPQRSKAQDDRIDVVHGRLEAQAVEAVDVEGMTFADLGLGDNIVRALAELGATAPFPIQASTAEAILGGRDVLARGRTGSGKTIAFGAPLVERMLRAQKGTKREYGRAPIALILAPTRELALQIDRTVQPIARSVGLFTTQIYGGVPQNRQVGALKRGVDIVIGTPGRIEDLHKQGKLDLSNIRASVLDEADHMCELGFLEPVQRILRLTANGGQKLLFSATLDREVAALVDEFLTDPAVYEVAGETQETGTIDHRVLVVEHRRKPEVLEQLVMRDGRTLVFTRTRAFAEQLSDRFCEAGVKALALHGDLTQARRSRNIEKFAKGSANVLVATDVAARGIHVDDVDLVVQADAPDEYKTYLHRSGRTGRAGNEGRVVTLIPRGRKRRMEELLDRAEIDAPFEEAAPGDELLDELAGAPTVAELTTR